MLEVKPFTGEEDIPARIVEPGELEEAKVSKTGEALAKRLYRLAASLEDGLKEFDPESLARLEAKLAETEKAAGLGSEA